jgi:hypothetical protein
VHRIDEDANVHAALGSRHELSRECPPARIPLEVEELDVDARIRFPYQAQHRVFSLRAIHDHVHVRGGEAAQALVASNHRLLGMGTCK